MSVITRKSALTSAAGHDERHKSWFSKAHLETY